MRRWSVLWLAGALLLAGCAGTPPRPEPADPATRWLDRQQALQALDGWHLSGRLAVREEGNAWHARIEWQEGPRGYEIRLRGPFGQGQARLIGSADGVVLDSGDTELEYARDPSELLHAHTGVWMPVDGLRWWIRGLPGPQYEGDAELDAYGRLDHLIDAGWTIDFKGYTEVGGLELPRRLFIEKDGVEVRVVIDRWRLPAPDSAHAQRSSP